MSVLGCFTSKCQKACLGVALPCAPPVLLTVTVAGFCCVGGGGSKLSWPTDWCGAEPRCVQPCCKRGPTCGNTHVIF
jgi:hypothetical protein